MSESTGTSPPSADSSPLSVEDFNALIEYTEVLLALGKRLSTELATHHRKEYLLSEASMVFIKTLLSLQGFLRFIPSSQFRAKEGESVIDLSSASLMARQTIEDAVSFFYLSQPSLTDEQKKFRIIAWRLHGALETFTYARYLAEFNPSLPVADAIRYHDATLKDLTDRLKEPIFASMLKAIPKTRQGKFEKR